MSNLILPDAVDRQRALDIGASFIVQAPAGSGKTELLTLRYLKLIAVCNKPEEVLAITFTRKAANEMRDRILKSLTWAVSVRQNNLPLESELEKLRYAIAIEVMDKDEASQWKIIDNPSRLRVQTIDAFCLSLAEQLPILSRLGGHAAIQEDIEFAYLDAVRRTLAELNSETSLSQDIAKLLVYRDNNVANLESLLVSLLYKRDQWLSHILNIKSSFSDARAYLQNCLQELLEENLSDASAVLMEYEVEVVQLLNYATANLVQAGKLTIADFRNLDELPGTDFSSLPYWSLLTNLFLTKDGEWRKQITVREGFPAGDKTDAELDALCKQQKQLWKQLLEQFSGDDDLLEVMAYLGKLPNPNYDASQWDFLSALIRVLEHLAGQLLLSFRQLGVIDYSQTGAAARNALGSAEAPTDLALSLDHRIQHVLVDEFQDTSQLQLEILNQLTNGWEADDGRTLFLVGDAMQSCYSFRNANVGIYLDVQKNGLPCVLLETLTLKANFRSQEHIVNWVNEVFSSAFPNRPNSSRGAVPYTHSTAIHEAQSGHGIEVNLILDEEGRKNLCRELQARQITTKVQALQADDPEASIAILARNRAHLSKITPLLRDAGVKWQSTDIDRLKSLSFIEDCLSLTRAIVNQGDRIAWLAILRAPWSGLNIADLLAIETFSEKNSLWWAIQRHSEIATLSEAGNAFLIGVVKIMEFATLNSGRASLRDIVEACWYLLRGQSLTQNSVEEESVEQYFLFLSQYEKAGGLSAFSEFEAKVLQSFMPVDKADETANPIHLLTMHQSKGLEFDHVLLPSLAESSRSDTKPLLKWHERLNKQGTPKLFIAALSATGSDDDMLYTLIGHEQKVKSRLEDARLLYIAVTRAKKSASLYASLNTKKGKINPPSSQSLLRRIWRELQNDGISLRETTLTDQLSDADIEQAKHSKTPSYPEITPLKRYVNPVSFTTSEEKLLESKIEESADSSAPEQASASSSESVTETLSAALPSTDDPMAAACGTLIHRFLESHVRLGCPLDADRIKPLEEHWALQLRNYAGDEGELKKAVGFVKQSILQCLEDEDSRWIFDRDLEDSQCEFKLSYCGDNFHSHYVVDRSFIDTQGTRWIIDYKSSKLKSTGSESEFIAEQIDRYQGQLHRYRDLFQQMESRPIKIALYLSSIPKLVELN